MHKLTAIIPCKNEKDNIEDVIKSVNFADEIMVVDSFSSDNTVTLARKHTNFILEHEYKYSAAQKNWAIPQANNEWILLVDADERVTDELKEEVQAILKGDPQMDAYWIHRENYFMGKKLRFGGTKNDKVIRLFKRDSCRYEDKNVHAEIITEGGVGMLKNKLRHNSYKNLGHYLDKINTYTLSSAKDFDKKTGMLTPYHFVIKPAFKFFQFYMLKLGFLDGFVGFVVAVLASYSVMLRYINLWELRKNNELAQTK